MIDPHVIHRLLGSLARAVVDPGEDEPPRSVADQRELLADFAGLYDLDLQDYATLVRVASGEAIQQETITSQQGDV